jgi:GNAT superfamily N-acetyltransferase
LFVTSQVRARKSRPGLRTVEPTDHDFLTEMARWASWLPGRELPDAGAEDVQEMVSDWGRSGDMGVVATDETGKPLGAAWCRLRRPALASVDGEPLPEMYVAVGPESRRRGVGRALIDALVVAARNIGHRGLALNVHERSDALRLYEAAGFNKVGHGRGKRGVAMTIIFDARRTNP